MKHTGYYWLLLAERHRIRLVGSMVRWIAALLLATGQAPSIPGTFVVSPDGRTILYSQVDSSGSDLMLVESFR